MQPIDLGDNFFRELKLENLNDGQKREFLQNVLQVLNLRVGSALAESLTDEQVAEFDDVDDTDPHASWVWLEQNCPQYKTVVATELESLKKELLRDTAKILGT